MKILIAAQSVATIGGSESHTLALYEELANTHPVVLCAAGRIQEISEAPDAAILSQWSTVNAFFTRFPDFPPERVIQTVHGFVTPEQPYVEKPIQYVTVSEELREHVTQYIKVDHATTITQGVSLAEHQDGHELPENPGSLLSLAQSEPFNDILREICEKRGIEFRARNKHVNPTRALPDEIRAADIVVSLGRGAVEAMACGRAVLVADHRPYQPAMADGWITLQTYKQIARCNFSGRRYAIKPDPHVMEFLLDQYELAMGFCNSVVAGMNHNIADRAKQYLEVLG